MQPQNIPPNFDITVRVGCSLVYEVTGTASLLLNLKLHPDRNHALLFEALTLANDLPAEDFVDSHGNHVCRVALAEGRQIQELAELLEKEGAITLRCPLLSILDAPDAGPVVAWLRELLADRFDLVVLLTGEGVRRLVGFAEREGLREAVIAAFGRTRTVTRGPKRSSRT